MYWERSPIKLCVEDMNKYNPDQVYEICNEIAHREIEGQILILRPNDNFLYTLNGSGKFLWLELKKKKTLTLMIKSLAKKFGIAEEIAASDVRVFVTDMEAKGILKKKGK